MGAMRKLNHEFGTCRHGVGGFGRVRSFFGGRKMVCHVNPSAVSLDIASRQRQSQTGSFGFRGEKRRKNFLGGCGRNAVATVHHFQPTIAIVKIPIAIAIAVQINTAFLEP